MILRVVAQTAMFELELQCFLHFSGLLQGLYIAFSVLPKYLWDLVVKQVGRGKPLCELAVGASVTVVTEVF